MRSGRTTGHATEQGDSCDTLATPYALFTPWKNALGKDLLKGHAKFKVSLSLKSFAFARFYATFVSGALTVFQEVED